VSPLPLGMSYPQLLTVHAARAGPIRYGRTSVRLPCAAMRPGVATDHIRINALRDRRARACLLRACRCGVRVHGVTSVSAEASVGAEEPVRARAESGGVPAGGGLAMRPQEGCSGAAGPVVPARRHVVPTRRRTQGSLRVRSGSVGSGSVGSGRIGAAGPAGVHRRRTGRQTDSQGAAFRLRPPEPGCEARADVVRAAVPRRTACSATAPVADGPHRPGHPTSFGS
jgi:hypothetical protein